MSETARTFPPLYKLVDGALQDWTIRVDHAERPVGTVVPVVVTRWGRQGGKYQESHDVITQGKNVGKKNETTPFQQAEKEAQATWEKQQKARKYCLTPEAAAVDQRSDLVEGGIDPMLAHPWDKKPKAQVFPLDDQPKLDGHRCTAEVLVTEGLAYCKLWTRTRKPIYSMPHIQRALEQRFVALEADGIVNPSIYWMDGELYFHDLAKVPQEWLNEYPNPKEARFQYISSLIRCDEPPPNHEVVEYHMYDTVNDQVWSRRKVWLDRVVGDVTYPLAHVKTRHAATVDEMMAHEEEYVSAGYEGLIARSHDGSYEGKRVPALLKVKRFIDTEFEVIGVETETRRVVNSEGEKEMVYARFVCKMEGWTGPGDEPHEFRTMLNAGQEVQRGYLTNPGQAIGKLLTVKHQGYTADNKPRIPKGLRFQIAL